MDCLDCNECRINRTKGIIYCRQHQWEYEDDGREKVIKLTPNEMNWVRINKRKIFSRMAKNCTKIVIDPPITLE